MDYGRLIRDAWSITWRHRFLWVLGFFVGGAFGGSGGGGGRGIVRLDDDWWRATPGRERLPESGLPGALESWFATEAPQAGRAFGGWIAANLPLIMAFIATMVVLALVYIVLSFIAQGGLTYAISEIAHGRPMTARTAWGAGWRLASRYLGLWLLLLVAILLVVGLVGGMVASVVAMIATSGTGGSIWIMIALAVIAAIPLVLAGLIVAIGLAIVVTYAQRAMAIHDCGPITALGEGWRLLRANLGASLLVWLLSIGLAIGVGIVAGFIIVLGASVVGGAVALLWFGSGLSPATIATAGLGGLAFVAIAIVLAAITNTFLWSYWTLAYLRLIEGDRPLPAPAPAAPVAPISPGPAPA